MSVSISEVVSSAGYDISTIEGARWLLSQCNDWDDLIARAEDIEEEYSEYEDFIFIQEDELGNYNNPSFEEWRKEKENE